MVHGLVSYNESKIGPENYVDLNILVRDGENNVVGGLLGYTHLNWLFINLMWLAEDVRGQHIGRRVLQMAEAEAIKRGCSHCHLDTFDFQAREFYEACGYSVFGCLDDYPSGHKRYFLQKRDVDRENG